MERRDAYRRSIVAARDIPRGEPITRQDLTFRRPGTGMSPMDFNLVVGMTAARDIAYDMIITEDDLAKPVPT